MGRTCLIISVLLSKADLHEVNTILESMIGAKKKYRWLPKELEKEVIPYFEGTISDLQSMVFQSRNDAFKFNLYILKMTVVKSDYLLSILQLRQEYDVLEIYALLKKNRDKLNNLLKNLLEPF